MSKSRGPLVVAFAIVTVFSSDRAVAQTKMWDVVGPGRADCLGRSLTFVSDADGDGVPDLLVGAPNDYGLRGNPGRVLLYSGATNQVIREFDGDTPDDAFGAIVANLGDVDGDGLPDFAIAAPLRNRDVPGVPQGAVFVYSGSGPLIRSYTSIATDGKVGEAMTALGDVDGDGANDLVYSDLNAGAWTIFVVSGATGATIWSLRDTAFGFGFAVGQTGDTDADGVEDFAVCDAASGGHVHVYSGSTGSKLFTFAGLEAIVKPAGDVDLDGHADLILANVGSGKVPVVSGVTGKALYTFTGNAFLGYDVSSTGDFDGDGVSDLVVLQGITAANPYDVFIYSGANGALVLRYTLGRVRTVDATADLDGDGVSDIIGGNEFEDSHGGSVSIASGATGPYATIFGESFSSKLATSLTVVNDRDGDGFRDVALAASGGLDANRAQTVEIVSGFDGHEISRFAQATGGVSDYPHAIVFTGDADGDGVDDLAIAGIGSVEVHSGLDDSLIETFQLPGNAYVNDVAAATDINGAPLLAVTSASLPTGFVVYDLATGNVVTLLAGHGDDQIACVGDVDGDGYVDWVVEDASAYLVNVVSGGPSPTVLWTFTGTATDGINCVTSTGDLDGDGIDEVLIGWTGGMRVTARSGKTGSMIGQVFGTIGSYQFGASVASLGDVNGDGVCDFAVSEPGYGNHIGPEGAVDLYSGATFEKLMRIEGRVPGELGIRTDFAQRRWHDDALVDPDAIPDLVCGNSIVQSERGHAEAFRLPPLFLLIDPSTATAGQKVVIGTHGGPAGATAGLYAVAIDGVPVDVFVAFGTIGPLGNWSIKSFVPSGLAGHTLTLRSYAIGFSGKVVASSDETLTFQ